MMDALQVISSTFPSNTISRIYNIFQTKAPPTPQELTLSPLKKFELKKVFGHSLVQGNIVYQSPVISKPYYNAPNTQRMVSTAFGTIASFGTASLISPALSVLSLFKSNKRTIQGYTYHQDFAIAIADGPISMLQNVYLGDQMLDLNTVDYTVYRGDGDYPDFLSSFKGVALIYFRDFDISAFGNSIPNFSFEVARMGKGVSNKASSLVKCVTIIPGSGEYVLDTTPQSKLIPFGNEKFNTGTINISNHYNKVDAKLALDNMKQELPNVEWVAPVIGWFTHSLDVKDATVMPKVEHKDISISPDEWSVAGKTRANASTITRDASGRVNYGGTINDLSVIRFLDEVRGRGYKVMFYPMLFVDTPGKPWRGHIDGHVDDVHNFFNRPDGYNNFILHYARLIKGRVDAFIIGSELKKITSITDGEGYFPSVDELVSLASQVREILGPDVKISYAADWSEYHHTDGGWYHLDPLWASDDIDFIGIDAYFPLTEDISYSPSIEEIKNRWESGEGYDYYYNWERTEKYDLDAPYAWKNIEWFLHNEHFNPDGVKTPWTPFSKKIWFTEYGFPSVDGSANQPNVFYNPDAYDGGVPRMSSGSTNFTEQKNAIIATEEYWADKTHLVENKMLWTYDARPFPDFPNRLDVWADGHLWEKGHWVNGKFMFTSLLEIIHEICSEFGLSYDVSLLEDEVIYGFAPKASNVKDVLDRLGLVYNFEYYLEAFNEDEFSNNGDDENDSNDDGGSQSISGKIHFVSLANATPKVIEGEIVEYTAKDDAQTETATFEDVSKDVTPTALNFTYLSRVTRDEQHFFYDMDVENSQNHILYVDLRDFVLGEDDVEKIAINMKQNLDMVNAKINITLLSEQNFKPYDVIMHENRTYFITQVERLDELTKLECCPFVSSAKYQKKDLLELQDANAEDFALIALPLISGEADLEGVQTGIKIAYKGTTGADLYMMPVGASSWERILTFQASSDFGTINQVGKDFIEVKFNSSLDLEIGRVYIGNTSYQCYEKGRTDNGNYLIKGNFNNADLANISVGDLVVLDNNKIHTINFEEGSENSVVRIKVVPHSLEFHSGMENEITIETGRNFIKPIKIEDISVDGEFAGVYVYLNKLDDDLSSDEISPMKESPSFTKCRIYSNFVESEDLDLEVVEHDYKGLKYFSYRVRWSKSEIERAFFEPRTASQIDLTQVSAYFF